MRRSEPEPESSAPRDDPAARSRRERSARYPGVPLADAVELARFVDDRGLDGLSAAEIASALGYKNIKTNTFSARLSAARQFGLLALKGDGYALTGQARAILHPVDPADLPRLRYQAFLATPLYVELADRLAGKRVPEASILANILYHHHQIIATAKQQAAEAFFESARFAGALRPDGTFRPPGDDGPAALPDPSAEATGSPLAPPATSIPSPVASFADSIAPTPAFAPPPSDVRVDLRLWGGDRGKLIRLRAPESITPESFERFLQAFRLHVRIEESPGDVPVGETEA